MRDRVLINALITRLGGSVTLTGAEIGEAQRDSTLQTEPVGDGVRLTIMDVQPARAGLTPAVEIEDQ